MKALERSLPMVVLLQIFGLVLALGALAPSASAVTACGTGLDVATINAGYTCQIDDKTFTFGVNSITGNTNTILQIDFFADDPLTPSHDPGFQIQFDSFSVSGLGGDTQLDLTVNYVVEAPGDLITDDHLRFAGVVTGDGFAGVGETVCAFGTQNCNEYSLEVFNFAGSEFDQLVDFNDFAPVSKLSITKDIEARLFCGSDTNRCTPGDLATISVVTQSFSEIVPEPASLLLLGSGLLATGAWMGRRRRS